MKILYRLKLFISILFFVAGCAKMQPESVVINTVIDRNLQLQLIKGMDINEVRRVLGGVAKPIICHYAGPSKGHLSLTTYTYKTTSRPSDTERVFLMVKYKDNLLYSWELVGIDGIYCHNRK